MNIYIIDRELFFEYELNVVQKVTNNSNCILGG